ncbi:uncharacterized protein LOC100116503 isoform X1 [Nasonia vitripennis]|uniref:Nahymenoptaecin-2 n=1 Tax=Nasonia vitripennis TaxID=7425 RepID=D4P8J1_NASVI|nr:uncharacterized protein LOC100116503 precursor [Nasonia vitripennis]XP_008208571.1 uncharacterized protein LOC100116503 isoform X1 [Nasonia vitripennis]ADD84774.1 nahymenoptaecin-2 precursor [Nasonia vitripennis]
MKAALALLAFAATVIVVSANIRPRPTARPPYINRPPNPFKPRWKREASPQNGHISVTGSKDLSGPERRPSWNVDYQHNIWQSKNGQISAGGGAQKLPGQRWEPTVGIQGSWRFKREANPGDHGSVSLTQIKPLSGPDRRPTYNLDYQHNIYNGKQGQITAGGGGTRLPGGRIEPTFGAHATWRFKREASPQNGHISVTGSKDLSGPERRPSWNVDYQHNIWQGKNGQITAGGGAQKLPGQRWEPTVGVQGSWRFKREANPGDRGSVSFTHIKPLSGPERRPTYNFDVQRNFYTGKQGQFTAGGGATRLPGGKIVPTLGATFRF